MKTEVILSDGRIAKPKKCKVRDLAQAEQQPKGKEHLEKYAMMAAKLEIDGKTVVLEDILDLYEDDMLLISELFIDEAELKNAQSH